MLDNQLVTTQKQCNTGLRDSFNFTNHKYVQDFLKKNRTHKVSVAILSGRHSGMIV